MRKTVFAIALFFLSAALLTGQEITLRGTASFLDNDTDTKRVTPSSVYPSFDVKLGWRLSDDGEFSRFYGNPVGGIGISYTMPGVMDFPYEGAKLGNGVSLYGFFTSNLVRSGNFSSGFTLEVGGSYLKNPFNAADNPLNTLYGGSLEYYFGGGLFAMYQISRRWGIGVEAGWRHHSSGAWYVPNNGFTTAALALDVKYTISEPSGSNSVSPFKRGIHDKTFRWGFYAAAGWHQNYAELLLDEHMGVAPEDRGSYKRYLKGSAGIEAFWRYSRFFATGLGGELFYFSNADVLKEIDQNRFGWTTEYSRLATGILLLQEVYYGRFAAHGGIGVYLSRKMGISEKEGPFYQKLGLRYYAASINGGFIGFAIRLHEFFQSDYMELTIGKHF